MDSFYKDVLWKQFGAAMDMFGNALEGCPVILWKAPMWQEPHMPPGFSEFWYIAFHTLFWLDLYLSGSVEGFSPPTPFTLDELDPEGILPERVYTREELRSYLVHCRQKCRQTIEQLTDERARRLCHFLWTKDGISFAGLLLDTIRHVQEHAAQLNMFLGQQAGANSRWIAEDKG